MIKHHIYIIFSLSSNLCGFRLNGYSDSLPCNAYWDADCLVISSYNTWLGVDNDTRRILHIGGMLGRRITCVIYKREI